jgi:hypothetical protein
MKQALPISILAIAVISGCRQTYEPPIVKNPPGYLVVEGLIETNGADSTFFTLSRTVPFSDTSAYAPERGATVTIEDSTGNSYPLTEINAGTYAYPPYPFGNNTKFRLHIFTGTRDEYASGYVPLVSNPPIDSISWIRSEDPLHYGVTIFASTHDPQNNTRYYRWSCNETWQFHVKYEANLAFVNNTVVPFTDTFYMCWKSDNSTSIALASSTQLAQDVIHEAPLLLVPLNSQKLQVEYSVLVNQYALTKEGFNWWQIMKKNTEEIGTIFGVQPSANIGNIHCLTDTAQKVIGFVGGCNTQKKRIFITNEQVLPWNYEDDCPYITVGRRDIPQFISSGYLLYQMNGLAYNVAHNYCVNCTLLGTNKQPSFWQ